MVYVGMSKISESFQLFVGILITPYVLMVCVGILIIMIYAGIQIIPNVFEWCMF